MNIQLLQRIRDWILTDEPLPQGYHFQMETWIEAEATEDGHWCGTACCIAGAALILTDPELVNDTLSAIRPDFAVGEPLPAVGLPVETLAAEILQLDPLIAEELFVPNFLSANTSPENAARVIDHLIKTGEVKWT